MTRTSPPFKRAIVIVLDGVGVGELPDAARYGDQGSDTVGHVAQRVPLGLPTLRRLGLGRVAALGSTDGPSNEIPIGAVGRMVEASPGKDSVTGHWELMGIVLPRPFPLFPNGFPPDILDRFSRRTGRSVIGNKTASGTAIVAELGAEHMRTGSWIVYTSADSVFQVAAHETIVPVPELYRACEVAYHIVVEGLGMGRVIARPFVGGPGSFRRTSNRRDYAMPPIGETLLDQLASASIPVVGIGKISDMFAGRGIGATYHTTSDEEGMDQLERQLGIVEAGMIFVNLVDFDTEYGHRNDPAGYARNLERFDDRLAAVISRLRADDLLVVTADHGNDPTTPSTDHSREYVPLVVTGRAIRAGVDLGTRPTFADVGQTLAEIFGVGPLAHGASFLGDIAVGPHRGRLE
ncbi:MAG TPA: phosphopentomutase [Vicinamibacterales bacterium]|nr:phosphopentomutase [Vicinamibacterales bacterium]